jgi:hypothetical protein
MMARTQARCCGRRAGAPCAALGKLRGGCQRGEAAERHADNEARIAGDSGTSAGIEARRR